MGNLARNLKFAARQLARYPGFTATVIVTLALSIGANTAIFSIVNALLLKSLPYLQPDRMGAVFVRVQDVDVDQRWIDGEQWEQIRDNVPAVLGAASSGLASGVNLQAGQQAIYLHDGRVTARYFDVLGIHPMLGRTFEEDEDRPGGPEAAILTYATWRNNFGADPSIVGRSVRLKGEAYTVIGVLPPGVTTPLNGDLYTPLRPTRDGEGAGTNFDLVVRLRDGATWQQADAQINLAWATTAQRYSKEYGGGRVAFYTVPLQKSETVELGPQALALMLASGFILFIACANLAGLTLVRMARRTAEIATRLALGASAWQIQKQLWIENLLLACIGGAAGIGVGFFALHGLLSLLPRDFLPVTNISLDARVLAFTLAVTLLTSLLFGMLPALAVRKVDLRSSMASRSVAGAERLNIRQLLIAGEVALSVALLAGAGLLIRTLIHLETIPPSFNPDGVMAAKASLDDARYHDPAKFRTLLDESLDAMRRIPGVANAGVGLSLPYERALNGGVKLHDGPEAGQMIGADQIYVTPGYFETLQAPLIAGRFFTPADGPKSQPVAIVNRTFAHKFFPGMDPIGRTLDQDMIIVGVVPDMPLVSGLNHVAPLQTQETIYTPAAQLTAPQALTMVHAWFQPGWVVRAAGPMGGLTAQMQQALSSAAPGLPFSGFYRMNDLRAESLVMQRVEVALLGAMAGLALLLSTVGIFALVASTVAQRTREIGIRIALGSTVRQAMARATAPGVRAAMIGLAAGLALSAIALRAMRSVLYGVGIYDAPTLAGVVLTLLAITLFASAMPALRIARIDPAKTLREE